MLITLLASVLSLMAAAPAAPPAAGTAVSVPSGSAPAAIRSVDEGTLRSVLSHPEDGLLVVNFWATWCGPCLAEIPDLELAAQAHPNVTFLMVNVDDRPASLDSFLQKRPLSLPLVHLASPDLPGTLSRAVPGWSDVIPMTLVIGTGGQVTGTFSGGLEAADLSTLLEG